MNLSILVYYTILSNLVCLLYFLALLPMMFTAGYRLRGEPSPWMLRWKGMVTMMVTVTLLVYHFLLAPRVFSMNGRNLWTLPDLLVHYIVPGMTILDWVLFDPKGVYRKTEPFLWLLLPYLYFAFALVRGQIAAMTGSSGSRYPYYFLDVDVLGWAGVGLYVLSITLFFLALGYGFLALDRLMRPANKAGYYRYKYGEY